MTRMTYRTAGSVALVLAASFPLFPRPVQAQSDTERLLRGVADASKDDLEGLRAGAPFVRTIGRGDRTELTLVYAVRVRAPVQFVLDQARSQHLLIDDAQGHEARGFFSDPPVDKDLAALLGVTEQKTDEATFGGVIDGQSNNPNLAALETPNDFQ